MADHETNILNVTTSYFKAKPRFVALLKAVAKQCQDFEDVCQQILATTLRTAGGVNLDWYGEVVGLKRDGMTDHEYYNAIRAQILANYSKGEIWRIVKIVWYITGAEPVKYTPLYPAAYSIMYQLIDTWTSATVRAHLIDLLPKVSPSGVEITEIIELPIKPFALGFAGEYDAPSIVGGLGLAGSENYADANAGGLADNLL